jgi:peptidoglycan/LPS O-acetylase OafA/YrhL
LPALLATFALNALTCRNSTISLYCTSDSALASHAEIPPQLSQKISDLISNAFFLQPFKGTQWGGNGPLWSLSYEFWYYIVFFSITSVVSYLLKREISFGLIPHLLILFLASRILDSDWFGTNLNPANQKFTTKAVTCLKNYEFSPWGLIFLHIDKT